MNLEQLARIARSPFGPAQRANALSFLMALENYGPRFGLDQPHRLVPFVAQAMHESGAFQWDREIWGPTAQQLKYDPASGSSLAQQLGNTQPGDGRRYYGRTGGMLTGRTNYRSFTIWCRRHIDPQAPDFEADPDKAVTDPWEGLVPLWYWHARGLNRYADQGDFEMITRRINGGLTGYDDRLAWLTRASLVVLGYGPLDLRAFQTRAQQDGLLPPDQSGRPSQVDGLAGPRTRSALHQALVALTAAEARSPEVKAAPVVEEKAVPVTPPALDKPIEQTGGFWERIGTIGSAGFGLGTLLLGDWRVTAIALGGIVVISTLGLVFHKRIIDAVKGIKAALAAPASAA